MKKGISENCIKNLDLDSWLFSASILPANPQVVISAREMVNDEYAGMDDLAEVIQLDQVLTLRIMRLALSTFKNADLPSTLEEALMKLGLQKVAGLLDMLFMRRGMFNQFAHETRQIFHDLATHSMLTSFAAEELQLASGNKRQGLVARARLLGLIHDIGRLTMLTGDNTTYKGVTRGNIHGHLGSPEREHKLFGFDHQVLGGKLAREWNLGEEATWVIEKHHAPEEAPDNQPMTRLISLADWVAIKVQVDWTVDLQPPHRRSMDQIHLVPAQLRHSITATAARWERVKRQLQFISPDL